MDVFTLVDIFGKFKIALYQNESLDLDHFYPEPYQDEGDEIKEIGPLFETDKSRKIRHIDLASEDSDVVPYLRCCHFAHMISPFYGPAALDPTAAILNYASLVHTV